MIRVNERCGGAGNCMYAWTLIIKYHLTESLVEFLTVLMGDLDHVRLGNRTNSNHVVCRVKKEQRKGDKRI